jgi:carboxymethylenebutenolidase
VALEGFTALGLDLLSPLGGTPKDEDQAREMIGKTDRMDAARNAAAAIAYLKGRPDASGPVGATGFCWGGGMTNLLATVAPDLAAGAPYYGLVVPTAEVPKIKAKLQLHYAGNDPRINEGLPGYEAALKAAGVSYQLFVYQGAEHAFNNDTNAARYNKQAADLAWSRTIAFFKQTLAIGPA